MVVVVVSVEVSVEDCKELDKTLRPIESISAQKAQQKSGQPIGQVMMLIGVWRSQKYGHSINGQKMQASGPNTISNGQVAM